MKQLLLKLFIPIVLGCNQPNILYIMLDDLGYEDLGFQGSDILTPNIDRLASEGVILENHYVMPVCAPTRAAYLTGKHATKTGFWYSNLTPYSDWGLGTSHTTIPQMLREYNYSTHAIGKWHLGMADWAMTPVRRGFDTFLGQYQGSGNHFTHILQEAYDFREDSVEDGVFSDKIRHDLKGNYSSFVFTNKTVDLINQERDSKDPWYIHLAYTDPHGPYEVPLADLERFSSHITPDKFSNDINPQYIADRRVYATMVSLADEGVGRIVDILKKTKQLANTLIVITSDNGAVIPRGPGSNYPLKGGKASFYEGGVKSVAVVFSPLLNKTGYINKNIHHIVDWLPTFEFLARCKEDEGVRDDIDGVNIWASLDEEKVERNETLINMMVEHKDDFGFHHSYSDVIPKNLSPEHFIMNGSVLQLQETFLNSPQIEPFVQMSLRSVISEILTPFLGTKSLFVYRWYNWKVILGEPGADIRSSSKSYSGASKPLEAANKTYVKLTRRVTKRVQLYDLGRDPEERDNVAKGNPRVVRTVARKLLKYLGTIADISDRTYSDRGRVDGVWMPWLNAGT